MKLPIQARPIVRSVSSAKISDVLMNGVTASQIVASGCDMNNPSCEAIAKMCTASRIRKFPWFAQCISLANERECHDCIGSLPGDPFEEASAALDAFTNLLIGIGDNGRRPTPEKPWLH